MAVLHDAAAQAPAAESDPPAAASDRFADALERLNEEIARRPNRIEPRFERARLLEARGLPDAAMQDYRWLLDHRPELPEAYNNMARLLAARGELSRAISLLEQGLSTHPVYQLMFDNLRTLYESMARQAYRAALSEPDSPEQVVPVEEDFSVGLKDVESMDATTGPGEPAGAAPGGTTTAGLDGDMTGMAIRGE